MDPHDLRLIGGAPAPDSTAASAAGPASAILPDTLAQVQSALAAGQQQAARDRAGLGDLALARAEQRAAVWRVVRAGAMALVVGGAIGALVGWWRCRS